MPSEPTMRLASDREDRVLFFGKAACDRLDPAVILAMLAIDNRGKLLRQGLAARVWIREPGRGHFSESAP